MHSVSGQPLNIDSVIVARVWRGQYGECSASDVALPTGPAHMCLDELAKCAVVLSDAPAQSSATMGANVRAVVGLRHLDAFIDDDVVAVFPSGVVTKLYDASSDDNVIFVTSKCNCRCLMCPQRSTEDEPSLDVINRRLLALIPPSCRVIAITGGEPTISGNRLFEYLEVIRDRLPLTSVHLLTNGRAFKQADTVKKLARTRPKLFSVGVPLYGDNPRDHDRIMGHQGAFDDTVHGLLHLGASHFGVELRIVLMRQTISRLTNIAEFIWHNLPFVSQVSFMGLEPEGDALKNLHELWVDPVDYQESLLKAVEYLELRGIHVGIFNEQLCVLRPSLWRYACRSISKWKRIYIDECGRCTAKELCGGLFASARSCHSRALRAIPVHVDHTTL